MATKRAFGNSLLNESLCCRSISFLHIQMFFNDNGMPGILPNLGRILAGYGPVVFALVSGASINRSARPHQLEPLARRVRASGAGVT